MKNTLLLLATIALFAACQKNNFVTQTEYNEIPEELLAFEAYLDLPPTFASYQRRLPDYLQIMGLVAKPADDARATLGRVLFYDKNLSLDNAVACASCHNQALAFSDNVSFSKGIYGYPGNRNAMPLANVASFSGHYAAGTGITPLLLWDQRAADVAEQSTLAFLNNHEMGMTMQGVVDRIKEQPYYPVLWKRVYGHFDVQQEQVLECLEEFVGAIGSANSRFDKTLEKVNGDINAFDSDTIVSGIYVGSTITTTSALLSNGMTSQEIAGKDIFIANCSKCHSPIRPLQEVFEACNGLDLDYKDPGKGQLTGNSADAGVFKAPSLRNIELTAPYMHDGRFSSLAEVVDFYSSDVKAHPNLHAAMVHDGSIHLNLSAAQKLSLVAFLKTLTDEDVAMDERFSDPFKK